MQLRPLTLRPSRDDYPSHTQAVSILFCRNNIIERGSVNIASSMLKSNTTTDASGRTVFIFGWFPHPDSPNYSKWLANNMAAALEQSVGVSPLVGLPENITPKRKIRIDEDIPSDTKTDGR